MSQKTDKVVTTKTDMGGVRALALTLRKRYGLTFPVGSAEHMLENGFKLTITNNKY